MRKKYIYAVTAFVVVSGIVAVSVWQRRQKLPEVEVELIERRDLQAVVAASGKIQPKRLVNISADTIGRVTRLAVEEGDRVKKDQFLMQIDPEALESAVRRGEAGLGAAREAVVSARVAIETARATLQLSQANVERQRRLFADQLVSKEILDRAESELKVRESELKARKTDVRTQEQRLQQEVANLSNAKYNLDKVTILAPMDGLLTRLNIEEGETVLMGTMNNPGTIIMTVADMSVIQAELEVDETDIVDVRLGQRAEVIIDAFPDNTLNGTVTKIGSSAMQQVAAGAGGRQATMFEVEVTLKGELDDARPDFSCSADITTATRTSVISVPIQALTVREMVATGEGGWVPPEKDTPAAEREELEGVFVLREQAAFFVPIEVGIAGERYFEVLQGLEQSDAVIIGPFDVVRELKHEDEVRIAEDEDEEKGWW